MYAPCRPLAEKKQRCLLRRNVAVKDTRLHRSPLFQIVGRICLGHTQPMRQTWTEISAKMQQNMFAAIKLAMCFVGTLHFPAVFVAWCCQVVHVLVTRLPVWKKVWIGKQLNQSRFPMSTIYMFNFQTLLVIWRLLPGNPWDRWWTILVHINCDCEVAVLLGYGKCRIFADNLVRKQLNNIHIGLMRPLDTQIQSSLSVANIVFKCRSTPGIFRTVFRKIGKWKP